MPFTDPMADGPAIQAGSLRALKAGMTLAGTLELVRGFRGATPTTPDRADGLLQPDLPLRRRALPRGRQGGGRRRADRRRSAARGGRRALPAGAGARTCASSASRRPPPTIGACPRCSRNTSGFIYYVSITGITGVGAPVVEQVGRRSRGCAATPACRSRSASASAPPEQAAEIAERRRRRGGGLGAGRPDRALARRPGPRHGRASPQRCSSRSASSPACAVQRSARKGPDMNWLTDYVRPRSRRWSAATGRRCPRTSGSTARPASA